MSGGVLVTGSLGCIGSWVLAHLVREGRKAISFDLSDDRHRLDWLLSREEQEAITFVRGDLTESDALRGAVEAHEVDRIIHLAALQIPFCRANPVLGARVNVVGTVNVLEAAREADIPHVALASSLAVYGPPEAYGKDFLEADANFAPGTLYGVYKQANEASARVYFEDYGLTSTTLRPYTVYGVGRDQGLTSEPTKAMLAAAAGRPFRIGFGGAMQFHFASDAARLFIAAADRPLEGARGFNLGGDPITVEHIVELLNEMVPGAEITADGRPLPFPEGVGDGGLYDAFPDLMPTPVEEGVRATVEHFTRLVDSGAIEPRDE